MWVLYGCCIFVGYRLGWKPAILCAAIFLVIPIVVSTVQMMIVRVPTPVLTLLSTPVGVVSFILSLFALRNI